MRTQAGLPWTIGTALSTQCRLLRHWTTWTTSILTAWRSMVGTGVGRMMVTLSEANCPARSTAVTVRICGTPADRSEALKLTPVKYEACSGVDGGGPRDGLG